MKDKTTKNYQDFPNVQSMRHQLLPEEFPEGTYGSPIHQDKIVNGKSTPWRKGQYRTSAFVYADKKQHEDIPRQGDGAHPLNSRDKEEKKEQ